MRYVQGLVSIKYGKDTLWVKPLFCPVGRPFCVVRWDIRQPTNACSFNLGYRRTVDGRFFIKCGFEEGKHTKGA